VRDWRSIPITVKIFIPERLSQDCMELRKRTESYAHAYATVLPTVQPQPKSHVLCSEIPDQADRMGGPGMLNESMVESSHVVVNARKRMYCTTRDVCEQLRLCANAYDRLADTRIANMMAVEERAAKRKRVKASHASRKRANHALSE
jgi:hypothetical protein